MNPGCGVIVVVEKAFLSKQQHVSVVRAESDEDGSPNNCSLIFSALGQCFMVYGSSPQLGQVGSTVGGICLKKRGMTGSHTGEKEGIAQSADHDFLPVKTFYVQQ